jgi:hypothetical protein
MANDELFGPDGTQPLPADQPWPDPLGGLVTGSAYTDPGDTPYLTPLWVAQAAPKAAAARRRPPAAARRPTAPGVATSGALTLGAVTPAATPVAAALPSMSRQERRPSVARTTPVPVVPPTRNLQARPVPAARAGQRATAAPRSPASSPVNRRSGAGCSVFLLVIVVLVIAFVVLGVVLGHSDGTTGGFGPGGG